MTRLTNAKAAKRALEGAKIVGVEFVEGRPGGPNNNAVRLALDSGVTVVVNAYSGGSMGFHVGVPAVAGGGGDP